MTEIASAALSYAERGWRVFPLYEIEGGVCACGKACPSPGKHPRTAHGAKDASADVTIVRGWWNRWPMANVGIATGDGLLVVDLDVGGEKDGVASWMALGIDAVTLECTTGGGGHHLYFDSGVGALRNSVGQVGVGIDVRGRSGYVVAPPSTHASGGVYEWAEEGAEVAPLPSELRVLLSRQKVRRDAADGGDAPHLFGMGERNDGLTRIAGFLRGKGMSEKEMLPSLLATNQERCPVPMEEEEVAGIARSVCSYPAGGGFEFNEVGNGQRLVHRFGSRFKYVMDWNSWVVWDERRWSQRGAGTRMQRFGKLTVEEMKLEGKGMGEDDAIGKALVKWGRASSRLSALSAMAKLASDEPGIPVAQEELDADPMLLSVANGTIELGRGTLRAHSAADLITQLSGTDWEEGARCPGWERFLAEVFAGDQELIDYVQRAVGYSMTGLVNEHALFFCYGSGCNGKSTFLNVLKEMLGEYAAAGAAGLLQQKKGGGRPHPTEQAALHRKRLVICQELEEGTPWEESTVKTLTGGDVISTRRLYENPWDMKPTHTLWVSGNAKPIVKESTDGIWRRMRLIPFVVSFSGAEDPFLGQRLAKEMPGILQWAVRGCQAWQERGLEEPKAVQEGVQEYREEMDLLRPFLAECLAVADPKARGEEVSRKDLTRAYMVWCSQNGERGMSTSRLFRELRNRGYKEKDRSFYGLRLRSDLGVTGMIH